MRYNCSNSTIKHEIFIILRYLISAFRELYEYLRRQDSANVPGNANVVIPGKESCILQTLSSGPDCVLWPILSAALQ